jgi:hopanoid biosynthesis associated protein HpnK
VKQVIVCADDFGLAVEVNEAVEAGCRDGILTAASLMVGEAAAADAVERARRLPALKVGLHIVLVDGAPVSAPDTIPDLVDAGGRLSANQARAGFRFFFKPGVRAQLAREITAQFEAFRATGLPLDHVNCHKHMHLHPTVASLIIQIGRRFGMKAMRLPAEPGRVIARAEPGRRSGFADAILHAWTNVLRGQIRRAGLAANDQMFGLAWTGQMTEARLLSLLPHLPDGVSEIYFHPATARGPALTRAMPSYVHEQEFQALISPTARRLIAEAGIRLIGYQDLAPAP